MMLLRRILIQKFANLRWTDMEILEKVNLKFFNLLMKLFEFISGPTDPSNNSLSLSAEFDMEERKSAIVVSGPYIVYQLPEKDIYDDLIAIRRGIRDSEV